MKEGTQAWEPKLLLEATHSIKMCNAVPMGFTIAHGKQNTHHVITSQRSLGAITSKISLLFKIHIPITNCSNLAN